jgi:hypothetical protein
MTAKYTKRLQNIPNGLKLYQQVTKYTNICIPLQEPLNITQIVILGLKIKHLATLPNYRQGDQMSFGKKSPKMYPKQFFVKING